MFKRLWLDDFGGVVTTEYLMVMGVAAAGAAAGASLVRDSVTAGFDKMGRSLMVAVPDPAVVRRYVEIPAPPAAATQPPPVSGFLVPPAP